MHIDIFQLEMISPNLWRKNEMDFKYCVGQNIGWLIILSQFMDKHRRKMYVCSCACGNKSVVKSQSALCRGVSDCGCLSGTKQSQTKRKFNEYNIVSK